MKKQFLVSFVLIFSIVFFAQIVMAETSTSSQDETQNKQIKVIIAELGRVGKSVKKIDNQIKIIVKKISEVEKEVNDLKSNNKNEENFKIVVKKVNENDDKITTLMEKQKLLYKGMAEIERNETDSSKKVVTSIVASVDDKAIASINDAISSLKQNLNEIKSQLSSGVKQIKKVSANPYQDARDDFSKRNYKKALPQFRALVNGSDVKLRDNSQYWLAECYYALGEYSQSIKEFEKVFSFDETDKYDDAQLKLGFCYRQLKNNSRAIEEFERLIQYYPESEYKNTALKQISILK
ncbi:MAG: tetratricopeptide repeat protein [Candidatus Marinimicrobia bacterium]|jgi:TolA-binding protein|nr:tetratricopeptide repeat protein [Candidatus Neomarinimicrobiota bacterium]